MCDADRKQFQTRPDNGKHDRITDSFINTFGLSDWLFVHCPWLPWTSNRKYCSVIGPNCAIALMVVVGSNLLERNTIFNIDFGFSSYQKNRVWVSLKRFLKFHRRTQRTKRDIRGAEEEEKEEQNWCIGL